jgi:tetratricopeptide (TPR) repeat protein
VCVVAGAGGIGKTTLALRVAHRVAARHPGGVVYLDLHGADDGPALVEPHAALSRFLRALNASWVPSSVEEASAAFRTLTARDGVLVVLDNAASAAQVRPLLPSGSGCTTLITSRWSLADLDATDWIKLRPLREESGLQLLEQFVGARRVAREPEAAVAIVRRCGGLPLALRIAGARAASRPESPLVELAQRIRDESQRLDVLEVGDLSVRANLRLAYRVLSEAPQQRSRLAARLFRLAGLPEWTEIAGFAWAALVDLPLASVEPALELLVDAHLVEAVGERRYRFHDVVRLFAREQAHEAESPQHHEAALARLTACLFAATAVAAKVLHPDEPTPAVADVPAGLRLENATDAWAWFEREHTNLLLIARQRLAARQSLPQVRDLALLAIKFLEYAGHVAEQTEFGELAVLATQLLGDRRGLARSINILAVAMLREDRLDEGIALLERNLLVQRELGDRAGEAACLNNLGNALRDRGDFEGAERDLTAALAIRREVGDRYKEGSTLDNLGMLYQRQGDYARALALHEAGLAITRESGDVLREAVMLLNLGETLHLSGAHETAMHEAQCALTVFRQFAYQRGIGLALHLMGNAHAGLGRPVDAHRHWTEALALLDGLDRQTAAALRIALAGIR